MSGERKTINGYTNRINTRASLAPRSIIQIKNANGPGPPAVPVSAEELFTLDLTCFSRVVRRASVVGAGPRRGGEAGERKYARRGVTVCTSVQPEA